MKGGKLYFQFSIGIGFTPPPVFQIVARTYVSDHFLETLHADVRVRSFSLNIAPERTF